MTVYRLKSTINELRQRLSDQDGQFVVAGPGGPATMEMIDAIVKTLDELERRVDSVERLEQRIAAAEMRLSRMRD